MCINEDYNIVVIAYFIERINCFLNTELIQLNMKQIAVVRATVVSSIG